MQFENIDIDALYKYFLTHQQQICITNDGMPSLYQMVICIILIGDLQFLKVLNINWIHKCVKY